jgi:hypothetical protein
MAKSTVTAYHGTTSKYVPAIEAQGLEPAKHAGADAWAENTGYHVDTNGVDRQPSVYVTRKIANAIYFARLAAKTYGGKPTILQLAIPRDTFRNRFVPDEGSLTNSDNWRIADAVPPAWIVDAKPVPKTTRIYTIGEGFNLKLHRKGLSPCLKKDTTKQ